MIQEDTLSYLMKVLQKRKPASMRLCTLLDKPDRRVQDGRCRLHRILTFRIEFVVGYGLDYAQKYQKSSVYWCCGRCRVGGVSRFGE